MASPPNDLSQYEKNLILDILDLSLNHTILQSLLQGLYTLIVAITLWTIFSSPKKSGNAFLLTVIIILYVLTTIAFGFGWAYEQRALIQNGDNFFTVFSALQDISPWWRASQLVIGISGGISTFIVDLTIIWRCWALWGRRWRIIFMPGLCAIAGIVAKSLQILSIFFNTTSNIGNSGGFAADIDWALIYLSLTLATTLLCTLLIVYRIVRLASGVSSYRKIVEMVIESSAMYSLTLIVYLALVARNLESAYYVDIITAYVKVIAPTLLVGRVAASGNSNSGSQVIIHSTRDRSPTQSRYIVSRRESVLFYRDAEDSMTPSLGSYGRPVMESV
ncbi:hypothetical protein IW261DRAFT_1661314 [Armillaria novae-zelandiae]|uniref:Uncharacterized protein n=1 Tax=Armillaria novae-zelandiae TaxID=153914 RepID=A0AA39T916_9AGAR|nr:hypothetical protein IW261DRAFT_1661314 [Armillaria novae-zelandiae]